MNKTFVKFGVCLIIAGLLAGDAVAQRSPKRRKDNTQPTTNPTTGTDQQQNNNNQQPSGYDPYANIPIRVDTAGLLDNSVKKSLRNDNAFDKGNLNTRVPLPYEHLRWDDALYAEKVWRELDLREKMN